MVTAHSTYYRQKCISQSRHCTMSLRTARVRGRVREQNISPSRDFSSLALASYASSKEEVRMTCITDTHTLHTCRSSRTRTDACACAPFDDIIGIDRSLPFANGLHSGVQLYMYVVSAAVKFARTKRAITSFCGTVGLRQTC